MYFIILLYEKLYVVRCMSVINWSCQLSLSGKTVTSGRMPRNHSRKEVFDGTIVRRCVGDCVFHLLKMLDGQKCHSNTFHLDFPYLSLRGIDGIDAASRPPAWRSWAVDTPAFHYAPFISVLLIIWFCLDCQLDEEHHYDGFSSI